MIAYITVGVDDMALAKPFYSAFLPALGYELEDHPEGLSCTLPVPAGQAPTSPDLYVKYPFDGKSASTGNGTMIAFQARSQQQVLDLHAAALAVGGERYVQPGDVENGIAHHTSTSTMSRRPSPGVPGV